MFSFPGRQSPRTIVITGPSGAGKTTLLTRLTAEFGDMFSVQISSTSRAPRPGEVDGVDFHFCTEPDMLAAIEAGEFVEHIYNEARHCWYGTTKATAGPPSSCKVWILMRTYVVDAEKLKLEQPYVQLFLITAPSVAELETRLRNRGEPEESLVQRIATAHLEMDLCHPEIWDVVLMNDDRERAYAEFRARMLHMASGDTVNFLPRGVKLHYTPATGTAQPVRYALADAGVGWEDVAHEEVGEACHESCGITKTNMLLMEVEKKHYEQSMAMLRYVGRRTGLYPTDIEAAFAVDKIIEDCENLDQMFFQSYSHDDQSNPQLAERFNNLDRCLGDSDYFASIFSIADVRVFALLHDCFRAARPGAPASLPRLRAFCERVAERPGIKFYLQSERYASLDKLQALVGMGNLGAGHLPLKCTHFEVHSGDALGQFRWSHSLG